MKYLIWLVVLLAVVVWFQRAKKSMLRGGEQGGGASAEPMGDGAAPQPKARRFRRSADGGAETMVQCAHCGIHFPVSEAVTHASGALYCSEEHRRLASF
ncbi:PP0621 family protein [Herbaspirillum sp. YR522]|uniref:PP0621 family protein n=1 Tax=Herbaspirillum sp. YR522 TaxID=1144342 RepID=UPI00026FA2C4|nr:PP0621 family protein [Herbaspirillum sp. YR522]EJN02801.1 hypothetical protein PMI40_02952 [Herbaspirillum sp. YR522]